MSSNEAGPSSAGGMATLSTEPISIAEKEVIRPISYHFDEKASRISEEDVNELMKGVIASIIKKKGYDGIEASAMDYIMHNVEHVMSGLLDHTAELAMVARRRKPSARDAYIAIRNAGPRLQPDALEDYAKGRDINQSPAWRVEWDRKRTDVSEWKAPEEKWLPSDEEVEEEPDSSTSRSQNPVKKRRRKHFKPKMDEVPAHLPPLPPKHTWLSTPSFPIRSEDTIEPLALIDIKVSSTRLTEASLRGLISATDNAAASSREQQKARDGMKNDSGVQPSFKTDLFGTASKRVTSPQAQVQPPVTTPGSVDEENRKSRSLKGRTLSLRLRTNTAPQQTAEPNTSVADSPPVERNEISTAGPVSTPSRSVSFKRPSTSHRASLSLSIAGSRSATPLASPALSRRGMVAPPGSGSWTVAPTQSYFTWGPPTPGIGSPADLPLATPLTPGAGFVYPPTPSDLYAKNDFGANHESAGQNAEDITLPGVVNYKRSWYRRGNAVRKEAVDDDG
ncbi:uncharacterized protein FA14DRAFT_78197 [Meira miltonrushii]|uniref:Transcription initiation factor TFIID subunit 8 n=1 Tax=Meira miltonrushii TaxID=1280837 RepID=A0A316V724_9BASI|nr:uncharacterized protein FA14DRAFT_78197 [Meira miltonrushii]PWN32808.1 hypothetical protein FA14DRAFT_78197 [Meira miltonrushii]